MDIKKIFEEVYGRYEDIQCFFSPGRVNIIGDHIDYNGGKVFPAALNMGTYGAFRLREDSLVRMYSQNFPDEGIIMADIHNLIEQKNKGWNSYVAGVIYAMNKHGFHPDRGFDMCVWGDVPYGSGLSSSASLELLVIYALSHMLNLKINSVTAALIGQMAENDFCGVSSGIMDQFAVSMGKSDNAILLDTDTLDYTYVPVKLKDASFIICCTNKKRSLADSKYNERRNECEMALSKIKSMEGYKNINNLCELSTDDMDIVLPCLEDDILKKRVRHVITENERTYEAVEFLKKGDVTNVGRLMNESHISLRDDYEVTGKELDALFDGAKKSAGCLGLRMTGAGFGGCCISLVKADDADNFIKNTGDYYKSVIGYDASFYEVMIGDGPRRITQ